MLGVLSCRCRTGYAGSAVGRDCGYTELGGLNKLIHIRPYESLEERARIRQEAVKSGHWPPNTREFILRMENKILVPADFSPVK